MEGIKEDFDYEAVNDHVIPTKVVDPIVLAYDNKHINVVVPSDVSDRLSEQETVDSSIEVATISENEQRTLDSGTNETTTNIPPQNQKTRSLREIYEKTLVSDVHLQYGLVSSQSTFFEEAMKDAQWIHASEEVNENDEVVVIDEQYQDVNALQEKMKYIHIFLTKFFTVQVKMTTRKIMLKQKKKTYTMLQKLKNNKTCIMFQNLKKKNYLASRSRRQRRRSPSTLQGRNSSLSFFNEM